MFEKEAEEYRKDLKSKFFLSEPQLDLACQGFKDGYRKANEWHKVADRDLPKDTRYVWTNVGAGYHDDDGWWDDFGRLQNVIAWCEPKFEE